MVRAGPSKVVATAAPVPGMATRLAGLLPPMIQITHKWPNDVLVNRHKVAGILLESSARESGALDWLVIGVGVNVEHFPDDTE